MNDFLAQFLQDTALQYPFLMTAIMVLGIFRAIFKPLMGLLEAYVLATPTKDDDAKLEGFKAGKVYATIVWLVDFVASVKLKSLSPPKDDLPKGI